MRGPLVSISICAATLLAVTLNTAPATAAVSKEARAHAHQAAGTDSLESLVKRLESPSQAPPVVDPARSNVPSPPLRNDAESARAEQFMNELLTAPRRTVQESARAGAPATGAPDGGGNSAPPLRFTSPTGVGGQATGRSSPPADRPAEAAPAEPATPVLPVATPLPQLPSIAPPDRLPAPPRLAAPLPTVREAPPPQPVTVTPPPSPAVKRPPNPAANKRTLCTEILQRGALGELSEEDRDILRTHCR